MFHSVPGVPRGKMERFAGAEQGDRQFEEGFSTREFIVYRVPPVIKDTQLLVFPAARLLG